MASPIISVEDLSKSYLVGHREEGGAYRYTALRDVLAREVRNLGRKAADFVCGRQVIQGDSVEEYWALKNVSFEVQRGEVLGIIGRNGAGKSTLLKILSRITEPSGGRVTLRGRVASLLEVGTGFHPELTGRENIFLNGAILGMSRGEIRKKFDEIVAFAEIERFLDTPVKRYSSGMYVRLAFAVAAHLEPEILIVDEVLAVGDADFQRKCLGKMEDVSRREGRTVLFVSHNMEAVTRLTSRAILLENGSIAVNCSTTDAISTYLASTTRHGAYISDRDETDPAPHIIQAEVITSGPSGVHQFGQTLGIQVRIAHIQPMTRAHLGIQIMNQLQVAVTAVYAYPPECIFGQESGISMVNFSIPRLRLNEGAYHLRIYLSQEPGNTICEVVGDACGFEVLRSSRFSWWGPDTCVYREEFSSVVSVATAAPGQIHPPRRARAMLADQ